MAHEVDLNPHITKLEGNLGLPKGFLDDLLIESDWSFIIKGHAFLEAALATFLTTSTDVRLNDVFGHLQLGGGRTGKIAFADALELIDKSSIRFARRLGGIRNELVHKVSNVDFTFDAYATNSSAVELRNVVNDLCAPFPDYAEPLLADNARLFRDHGKMVSHFSLVAVVSDGHYRLHPKEGDWELEHAMLDLVLGGLLKTFGEENERNHPSRPHTA